MLLELLKADRYLLKVIKQLKKTKSSEELKWQIANRVHLRECALSNSLPSSQEVRNYRKSKWGRHAEIVKES